MFNKDLIFRVRIKNINVGNYTQWNYLPEEDARITVHNAVNYHFSNIRPHLQMSRVGKETTFV